MSSRVFVDPLVHSDRVARVQAFFFGLVLLALVGAVWIKWYLDGGGAGEARLSLMLSSVVLAAFFIGRYMMSRTRKELLARRFVEISEEGLRSMDLGGEVFFGWPEITEVRIGSRPSRTKAPDVLVRTGRGSLGFFMRMVDRDGEIPEPSLLAPGVRFTRSGGESFELTPDNSELVVAIVSRVVPERVKKGVITSI